MKLRNPFRSRKVAVIVGVIVGLLVIARLLLPGIILKKANETLATFSPIYEGHIKDIDLSLLALSGKADDITVKLKKEGDKFLDVGSVKASLAWRELFRGRILTDVEVVGANALLTDKVINAIKADQKKKDEEKQVSTVLERFRLERLIVRDSTVEIAEIPGIPSEQRWRATEIQTRISNLDPADKDAETLATMQATFMDSAKIKGIAKAKIGQKDMPWDIDMEMRGFDLAKANPVLKRLLPFSFNAGSMDMFMEAKSEKNQIEGYVKPFFRKLDVVGNQKDFAGAKHFVFEVAGAIGNRLLRRQDEKSVATKVPFRTIDGVLKVDAGAAVENVLEHGFDDKIAPSIEDSIQLQ